MRKNEVRIYDINELKVGDWVRNYLWDKYYEVSEINASNSIVTLRTTLEDGPEETDYSWDKKCLKGVCVLKRNYGYHLKEIEKGVLGEPSKIREEFEEFMDAVEQNNSLMALIELSDLLGAIEAYSQKYNFTLDDLIVMKEATKKAFESGRRK